MCSNKGWSHIFIFLFRSEGIISWMSKRRKKCRIDVYNFWCSLYMELITVFKTWLISIIDGSLNLQLWPSRSHYVLYYLKWTLRKWASIFKFYSPNWRFMQLIKSISRVKSFTFKFYTTFKVRDSTNNSKQFRI